MSKSETKLKRAYSICTLFAVVGSLAAIGMEFLVFLGVGYGEVSFNWLFSLSGLATLGLLSGATNRRSQSAVFPAILGASSIFFVIAYLVLWIKGWAPPAFWWLFFPAFIAEAILSAVALAQVRTTVVAS